MTTMYMRDPQEAFNDALEIGTLTKTRFEKREVSKWMYMYSKDGFDYFKNINYRHYIQSPIPQREV